MVMDFIISVGYVYFNAEAACHWFKVLINFMYILTMKIVKSSLKLKKGETRLPYFYGKYVCFMICNNCKETLRHIWKTNKSMQNRSFQSKQAASTKSQKKRFRC